jgi:hypothetical protein
MHADSAVPRRSAAPILIAILGGLGLLFYAALGVGSLFAGDVKLRAIMGMAWGLIVLWIIVGGLLQWVLRDAIAWRVRAISLPWAVKFVLFATLLALIEEAITVTMTNLAPLFGVHYGEVFITASGNYLDVVLGHSVIVFVPMFIAWVWMLSRWSFRPSEVLLIFGLTGTLSEMISFGLSTPLAVGFWVLVYGLMVALPAYSLPPDRGAKPPRWWHFPLALIVPILAAIPVAIVVGIVHPYPLHFQ